MDNRALGRHQLIRSVTIGLVIVVLLAAVFARSRLQATRTPIASKFPVDGYARSLAWSHDGQMLATADGWLTHITIWNANTGQIIQRLERGIAFGNSLAFMQGDKYLLTPAAYQKTEDDRRATVSVWEVASGNMVRNIAGPYPAQPVNNNMAEGFSLDRNDQILAAVLHGGVPLEVGIYRTSPWVLIRTLQSERFKLAASVAVDPEGQYLAVGTYGGAIDIYDIPTGRLLRTIDAYPDTISTSVTSLVFSPDGSQLLSLPHSNGRVGPDGAFGPVPNALRIWNVSDGAPILSLPLTVGGTSGDTTRGIAWSPDGYHIASASDDGLVRLWDIHSPKSPVIVARYPRVAWSVSFSPDGKKLAASGWRYVLIADVSP
jgi:WD40 repeat protein